MKIARLSLFAFAIACSREAALPEGAPHTPATRKNIIDTAELRDVAKKLFPMRGCIDIANDIATQAGPSSISCTSHDPAKAVACADSAVRTRSAFTLFQGGFGMDSYIAIAIVGRPSGSAVFYYSDSMGPSYKGTCLRQNVLSSLEGWPACRHQLAEMIDLRTCGPYRERWPLRYEEPWSAECRAAAARSAPRASIRLLHRVPLVPDLEKWKLRCRKFVPFFELIIDPAGNVQCARILSFSNQDVAPPPGLYDQMRTNLKRWKFAPPTLHGQPVQARWGMQDNPVCDQESR